MKTHSTYSQMTLQRFRPNRRRGWKRKLGCWLWTVVWMLVLWALLWWSFSALSGAKKTGDIIDGIDRSERDAVTPRLMVSEAPRLALAGLGASDAVAIAIVLCVIVGLLARLVNGRKRERHEAWLSAHQDAEPKMNCPHCGSGLLWGDDRGAHCDGCDDFDPETDLEGLMPVASQSMAASCPQCDETLIFPRGHAPYCENCGWPDENRMDADPLAVGGNEIPPSEEMPEGMTRLDVVKIVHAMAEEVRLILALVSGAMRTLSVDDYYDALQGAEQLLAQLRVTLCELRARFRTDAPQRGDNRRDEALNSASPQDLCGWGDLAPVALTSESQGLPVSPSSTGEANG